MAAPALRNRIGLVLSVVVAVACTSSDTGNDSARDRVSDRAGRVCSAYAKRAGLAGEASMAQATTAGEITSVAKVLLGKSVPPWDVLPPDHFVVRCDFTPLTPAGPPPTRCLDGAGLGDLRQVLVDEEGRETPDPTLRTTVDGEVCSSTG